LDIARLDVATGAVEWIVTDASDERAPSFSADGTELHFSSNRTGAWEAYSLDLASGRIDRWTRTGAAVARGASDGGIWFVRPDSPGLWRQSSADSEPQLVNRAFAPSAPTDWTVRRSDGRDFVYYLRRDEQHTCWLAQLAVSTGMNTDLLELEREAGIKEVFGGAGLWVSPDGSIAIVSSVDLSHSDLWLRRPRDDRD